MSCCIKRSACEGATRDGVLSRTSAVARRDCGILPTICFIQASLTALEHQFVRQFYGVRRFSADRGGDYAAGGVVLDALNPKP